ncbi:MAG: ATP-grasp domain-containing protein [Candidatus Woesebacteria bacterium]|jgi:biotin carboxylase
MARALIVGSGFSGLMSYLKGNDYDYILLKDALKAKSPHKRFKRRVVCDFSSKQSILAAVDSIKKPVDFIVNTYENYALPAAWIAEHLNLPGMPIKSIGACTDKFLMRNLFAKAPQKISPDFALIDSQADVINFANTHSFPLILKPANLAKSLLVTKNHDIEELLGNYERSISQIDAIYSKYAPHRKPRMLIEEFLEGSVHSVDAFTGDDGIPHILDHIVDYQTGYDIGYNDNFHYSRLLPSKLSATDQKAFKKCAELGVKALGMKNSPAHIEIIITKDGPRIVEIGARNGGYRERMHKLANGLDIDGAAIALAMGKDPQVTASKNESCAVLELFPKNPGFFVGIAGEDKLLKLPSLNNLIPKASQGDFVGKAADGYKMCAIVVLHNSDAEQFNKDLDFVNKHVHVVTKP